MFVPHRTYGSGYPGVNDRGVGSYPGFPFVFWPVIWPVLIGGYGAPYLHNSQVRHRLKFLCAKEDNTDSCSTVR